MRLCNLRPTPQGISVTTPYDAAFVAAFKSQIPATARKWDPDTKTWIVAPQSAPIVAQLIAQHFGQTVNVPTATTTKTGLKVRCELDTQVYPMGIVVTDDELAQVNLKRNDFHGEWNYTISPHTKQADILIS